MTSGRLQRLELLFLACVELPAEARAAFLDDRCAGDPALRAELEELLRHDQDDVPAVAAPSRIGPYALAERLGEGGFGEVYAAEQSAPVRRRVAIKILKAGMDSRAVLARFEAERQALARMEHPAIAKVFDAGETEAGRSYFVMELVAGEPITTYCEHHDLSVRDRLALFVPVCRAIEHAHRKGIIHRDLKPSNILVMTVDGLPHPKVIDFGIAKAIATDSEEAQHTRAGELLGTPEYMSPEQAASSGADVDTRSDVYSLGVVLYRLLTGRVPFESEKLRETPLPELQRVLREEVPQKPSTISPVRELRGELDWIVLKALEKDRERRYSSPAALADDIERYLRHEPTEAGPPSATYRLRKLVRRHRTLVTSAAAVAAALLFGLVATSLQAIRATRAEERARAEARVAASVNEFLRRMLAAGDPQLDARGRSLTVRELVDRAAKELEEAPPSSPEVEAAVQHTLGSTYRGLGLYDQAEHHLVRAIEMRRAAGGRGARPTLESELELATTRSLRGHDAAAESLLAAITETAHLDEKADPELRERYLRLRGGLGANAGRFDEADSAYSAIVAMHRDALAREPQRPTALANLASSLGDLAFIKQSRGALKEAEPMAREAYDLALRAYSEDHHTVAASAARLATVLSRTGELHEAEALYRHAIEMDARVLGDDHPVVAEWMMNLAELLTTLGKSEEAETTARGAMAILDRYVDTESRRRASAAGILATILQDRAKFDEAIDLRMESLTLFRRLDGDTSRKVATVLNNLGSTYRLARRFDEAARAFLEALATMRAIHGDVHPDLATALHNLGKTRLDQGRYEEAERLSSEAMDLGGRVFPPNHPGHAVFASTHGRALAGLGRIVEAKVELGRAREGLVAAFGEEHLRVREVDAALASLERK